MRIDSRKRVRIIVTVAALVGSGAARAQAADAETWRSSVVVDVTALLAGGNPAGPREVFVGGGLHGTLRHGPLVAGAGVDGATLLAGSGHTFLTLGAGALLPLRDRTLVVQGLFGVHEVNADLLFGDGREHRLRVVGLRATAERDVRWGILAKLSLTATLFRDVDRAWDDDAAVDVGGWTWTLGTGVGFGG